MIHEIGAYAFCCEDISKIENYDEAVADKTLSWDCHHKAAILPCGNFSREELIKHGFYYHRPPSELIFLTKSLHSTLHNLNPTPAETLKRKQHIVSAETRKKLSVAMSGKHPNAAARKKMSDKKKGKNHPNFGKHLSSETRKKISDSNRGNTNFLGRHHSEESKLKMADSKRGNTNVRGTFWWTNGILNTRAKDCPGEGWSKGRTSLKKSKTMHNEMRDRDE